MSQVIEVIKRARKRLENPKAWTKGVLARDIDGNSVSPYDIESVCWCVEGALRREAVALEVPSSWFLGDLLEYLGGTSVAHFNDNSKTTHSDVLKMLEDAIPFVEEVESR